MSALESYMVHSIQLDLGIGDEHKGSSGQLFSYWCITLVISPCSTRREIKQHVVIVASRGTVHLQNSYVSECVCQFDNCTRLNDESVDD